MAKAKIAKITALPYNEHKLCRKDHMLILITQPDGVRYHIESCGKINFYLAMMRQKYGWKKAVVGEYNEKNIKLLQKEFEEQDAEQNKAEGGEVEASSSRPPGH